jgi:hypothetical protein
VVAKVWRQQHGSIGAAAASQRNGGGISAARRQHGSMMVATREQGGYKVCDNAVVALPNTLPLLPKLRFCQGAASAVKLAAAAALPPRCHRRTTTAYKIKEKYAILLTNLFFTKMVTATNSNDGGSMSIAMLLLASRIA